LFPTLSANPELARLLVRCERWLQQHHPGDRDYEVTRTLAPVVRK
jgi:hypothetical protein